MRWNVLLLAGLLAACRSDAEKAHDATVAAAVAELEAMARQGRAGSAAAANAPAPVAKAPKRAEPLQHPCAGDRPYKDWSNAALSAALVEYMGKEESKGLIVEGGCRQDEGRL